MGVIHVGQKSRAHTYKGKNGYPIYKRRNNGKFANIRSQFLDNSWVVPYNPYLLSKFNCHINVEVCYILICKGHDKNAFFVHGDDPNIEIDEIKEYQSARWVSPPEATWCLFGFPISEMTPSVYHLQLHLDGQQFVSFKSTQTINSIVNNPMIRKIILTEFFVMNRENKDAKKLNLLYKEFPKYFVCTFREAAKNRGLLQCDNNLVDCMSEAVRYQMPYSLRRLFATLLVYRNPANPKELWNQFEDSMSEDFKILPNLNAKQIHHMALNHINDILHSMGHDINEFTLIPERILASSTAIEAQDSHFERNIIVKEEDLLLETKLNDDQ
ncbi:uncharacterized protein [Nicotiana sylvestris]|uniref:uncharacterized protein n=1 Tax=Nicotiana sylvestris TaxID=4096 RepID=UPI00388CB788